MDFDALLKQLQDWSNKVPLLVLGSGASVSVWIAFNVDTWEHLKHTLDFEEDPDRKQFEAFKRSLEETKDLEKTLLEIQLNDTVLKSVLKATWERISETDPKSIQTICFEWRGSAIGNINETFAFND